MKKLFGYLNLLLLAASMTFIASCGDDTNNPVDPASPTITASETQTITTQPQGAGETVTFKISGSKGATTLKAIKVTENSAPMDVNRFKFDGASQTSSTFLLPASAADGFSGKTISIDLPAVTGQYTYTVQLQDNNGKTDDVSVVINVQGLVTLTSDTMYNFLGPLAGGLEFATGKHVVKGKDFPNDPEKGWAGAHIRDNGNDVVGNTYPWKAEIVKWETTDLRVPSTAVDFDKVLNEAQIKAIHGAGTAITTMKLTVGKVFTALRDGNYYLVKVIEVKDDGKNSGTNYNLDYSRYSIKHK